MWFSNFYGDLEFIPKTKKALLEYYAEIGYLDDLDDFINEYGNGNGAFYLLKESISVLGCGGIRCIGKTQGELVRLWLRT